MRLLLVSLSSLSLALTLLAGCGRRDDGKISADPDAKLQPGMPKIYLAPVPGPAEPAQLPPPNPLAMNLKHDGPTAPLAASAPVDPCAVKDQTGPMAMRLRHDGPFDPNRRNPLCMRLK